MVSNLVNRVLKFKDLRKLVPCTNHGERIIEEYKLTYNDDGSRTLIVSGHKDIYEFIQSFKDSVDVHRIVEACTISGDMSKLYQTEGFYGDLSVFPTTRAEALQSLAEAENLWKKLPVEIKEKFDNNVNQFFATAFSKEWIDKLGIKSEEKIVNEVEKEVSGENE